MHYSTEQPARQRPTGHICPFGCHTACPRNKRSGSIHAIVPVMLHALAGPHAYTWSEDAVERLINRYVKKDELLRDRIRRMDEAESRTPTVKPPVKPSAGSAS